MSGLIKLSDIERIEGKLPRFTSYGFYPLAYLDGESNVLCANCANESDNEDEIPQFRPRAAFMVEEGTLWCDQSGRSGCQGIIA